MITGNVFDRDKKKLKKLKRSRIEYGDKELKNAFNDPIIKQNTR